MMLMTAKTIGEKKQFAAIALQNKLFVSGWCLSSYLQDMKRNGCGEIVLYFESNVPIGVGVVTGCDLFPLGSFFVRKQFRKQGIGTKMVIELRKIIQFTCLEGVSGSEFFFKKNGIKQA